MTAEIEEVDPTGLIIAEECGVTEGVLLSEGGEVSKALSIIVAGYVNEDELHDASVRISIPDLEAARRLAYALLEAAASLEDRDLPEFPKEALDG